jgi:hypothetical protein
MHSRQYSGDESIAYPAEVLIVLMPNLVARKMSFRFSALAANHFPRRASESPYLSAFGTLALYLRPGKLLFEMKKPWNDYPYPRIAPLFCTPRRGAQISLHQREMDHKFH